MNKARQFVPLILLLFLFCYGAKNVLAEDIQSVLFVPLIGITSVPNPTTLPVGPANVTYNYAVKNFIREVPLSNIQVVDDKCSSVKFVEGDDNHDLKLDFDETWRYACTTKLAGTTNSTVTVTGTANGIAATHKAYTTVIVGSSNPSPLVSIVNVTQIPSPLTLPTEGGDITYTFRVNNPGVVPLSDVIVTDDKCANMSGKLGDTNGNQLLDVNEVWIYSCIANISATSTNTASVVASGNGLQAFDEVTQTVAVNTDIAESSPNLFDISISPGVAVNSNLKIIVWLILSAILALLVIFFILIKKSRRA